MTISSTSLSQDLTSQYKKFACALQPGRRLLGIDVGSRRLGLALSDPTLACATPLGMFVRRHWGKLRAQLADVIDAHHVGGIVLGLPRSIDGREDRRCQATRAFAANLLAWRFLPLMFWDERLSSNAVAHVLARTKLPPRKRLAMRDQLEATYILQGALDYMRYMDLPKA